jgi:hypothetical protein
MAVAAALLFAALCAPARAHSNLAEPQATRKLVCRAGNNQPRDCYGPCPPMDSYGSPTGVNAANPAATWTRGESKFVAWQENNHVGNKNGHGPTGFTRLALVPVDQMMDKGAHEKHAFHISCWGAGQHDCPSRDETACGNDKSGKRYGTTVKVPTNYKDGVYVLGYSWYGGGDYQDQSFFGDYYSCSFIMIQGGPYSEAASTVFEPGANMPSDGCWSAADRPGVCPTEPCLGKQISLMRPYGAGSAVAGGGGSGVSAAGAGRSVNLVVASTPAPAPASDSGGSSSLPADAAPKGQDSGGAIEIAVVNVGSSELTTVADKAEFKSSDFPRGVNVEAKVSGSVSYVEFQWEGKTKRETTAPYLVGGNLGTKYGRWWGYPQGRYFTLTVVAGVGGQTQSKDVQLRFD